jgi:phosphopantetheinyl transferase
MTFIVEHWLFSIDNWSVDEQQFQAYLSMLPAVEQQRIRRCHRRQDQLRSLAGKLLTRCWLLQYIRQTWSALQLTTTESGRPIYQRGMDEVVQVDFNISHDGNWVALIGVASTCTSLPFAVGVDLVRIVPTDTPDMLLDSLKDQVCEVDTLHYVCTYRQPVFGS